MGDLRFESIRIDSLGESIRRTESKLLSFDSEAVNDGTIQLASSQLVPVPYSDHISVVSPPHITSPPAFFYQNTVNSKQLQHSAQAMSDTLISTPALARRPSAPATTMFLPVDAQSCSRPANFQGRQGG